MGLLAKLQIENKRQWESRIKIRSIAFLDALDSDTEHHRQRASEDLCETSAAAMLSSLPLNIDLLDICVELVP